LCFHFYSGCEIQKKKLSLPKITNPTLKKLLYYNISPKCTRIDACVDFTIKALDYTKSFRAFIDIDFCNYIFKVGFETEIHKMPIFVYPWGKFGECLLVISTYCLISMLGENFWV
jgi:hypothetical protein